MLIQFTNNRFNPDDDNIELFWKMYRLVRELNDSPMMWKLNDTLLDSLAAFLFVEDVDVVLTMTFMDASIDKTSKPPALLCSSNTYPFALVAG
jgi:hypothetical protein